LVLPEPGEAVAPPPATQARMPMVFCWLESIVKEECLHV